MERGVFRQTSRRSSSRALRPLSAGSDSPMNFQQGIPSSPSRFLSFEPISRKSISSLLSSLLGGTFKAITGSKDSLRQPISHSLSILRCAIYSGSSLCPLSPIFPLKFPTSLRSLFYPKQCSIFSNDSRRSDSSTNSNRRRLCRCSLSEIDSRAYRLYSVREVVDRSGPPSSYCLHCIRTIKSFPCSRESSEWELFNIYFRRTAFRRRAS